MPKTDGGIVRLIEETRNILDELYRIGVPGLDPRLPNEIIEYNLRHAPEDHILLLEDALALEPYTRGGHEIDPVEAAILEAAETDNLVLRGVFQRANKRNQNGRVYPRDILAREVKRLSPLIDGGRLLGEMDHPQSAKIRVPFTSHKITKHWMDEGSDEVFGELTPTHNSLGRDLFSLVTKDKVRPGVSSRGTGTLREEDGGFVVGPNYRMITYDIVADPSTHGAFPSEVAEEMRRLWGVAPMSEDINGTNAVDRRREVMKLTGDLVRLVGERFGKQGR